MTFFVFVPVIAFIVAIALVVAFLIDQQTNRIANQFWSNKCVALHKSKLSKLGSTSPQCCDELTMRHWVEQSVLHDIPYVFSYGVNCNPKHVFVALRLDLDQKAFIQTKQLCVGRFINTSHDITLEQVNRMVTFKAVGKNCPLAEIQ